MAGKDQAIGGLILLVCVVVAFGYLIALFVPDPIMELLKPLWPTLTRVGFRIWLIAIPVLIAFLTVLIIGAWIGWTMATTPPPKPLEEIEAEETRGEGKTEPAEEAEAEEEKEK